MRLYLSPHLDDVVLSCAGLIHRQVQDGDTVLVLTVMAGDPERGAQSAFAAEKARIWQTEADPVGPRRAEDRAALGLLGAGWLHWQYADCIFRHDAHTGEGYYPSEESLWGLVHPRERVGLVWEIAAQLQALCAEAGPAVVYAPLAVGHHVDHQVVRAAARRLRLADGALCYYEDYPYAEVQFLVDEALAEAGGGEARLEPVDAAGVRAKLAAIACYRSQMPDLFINKLMMRRRVNAYMRRLSPAGPAERYWQPSAGGMEPPRDPLGMAP